MPVKDLYANKFYQTVTESGTSTLTFSEIRTNVSIFEKTAWILHRLEYYWSQATLFLLIAAQDVIEMALTASDQIADLSPGNPSVIDRCDKFYMNYGTAASGFHVDMPIVRDFSGLPGGGLIVAPRPLFLAVQGASLAGPATVEMRGYFTQKELKADEYLELIDFYRIVQ